MGKKTNKTQPVAQTSHAFGTEQSVMRDQFAAAKAAMQAKIDRLVLEAENLRDELDQSSRLNVSLEHLLSNRHPQLAQTSRAAAVNLLQRSTRVFLQRNRRARAASELQCVFRAVHQSRTYLLYKSLAIQLQPMLGDLATHLQHQRVWGPLTKGLQDLCTGAQPVPEHWGSDWDDIPPPQPNYDARGALSLCDCSDLLDKDKLEPTALQSGKLEPTSLQSFPVLEVTADEAELDESGVAAEFMKQADLGVDACGSMEIWQQAQKWIEMRPNMMQLVHRVLSSIQSGQRGSVTC